MISTGFCAVLHIFICWSLVFKFKLAFRDSALSNSILYWNNVLILAAFIRISPATAKTWRSYSMTGLRNITNLFLLATPSAVMLCFPK
ncbi:hypothetical protein EJ110_NYTH06218 [Nymphaea thermarum]|nr:hypothetical protein EJ110_NYTH06218 [Nymphaea thermarum]